MAKKGNRVQVILECTEHKDSGMPGTSRYITTKNKKNQNFIIPSFSSEIHHEVELVVKLNKKINLSVNNFINEELK